MKITKKRILAVSYSLAVLLVLGGFILAQHNRAESYKRQVISSYGSSLSEFIHGVGQIDSALRKCAYAGTPSMLAGICADIYGKSETVRAALGDLPFSVADYERSSGFFARTGDLAYSLARKTGEGAELSDDEYERLRKLSKTASYLSDGLTQMLAHVNGGDVSMDALLRAGRYASVLSEGATAVSAPYALTQDEGSSPETRSAVNVEPSGAAVPRLLEGKSEIGQHDAASSAAAFMDIKRNAVKFAGERGGVLPVYVFSATGAAGAMKIEVTKQGGFVSRVISAYAPQKAIIAPDEAAKTAAEFLRRNGFSNMTAVSRVTEGNAEHIDFAYKENGAVCYPDRISVRVGLDEGAVTGVDSAPYIMNHHMRSFTKPEVNEESARNSVSKRLTILSSGTAVISTVDGQEVFCHEFKCEDSAGRGCLVYINAQTGAEETILLTDATKRETHRI